MEKIKSAMCLILYFGCFSACNNDNTTKKNFPPKSENHVLRTNRLDTLIKIYTAGDTKYILLDTLKFKIPVDVAISDDNLYDGIYEFRGDSLVKHSFLITRNVAFLTTFEDVGFGIRSRLYAFDIAKKSFIRDKEFKRDWLYSSAGVFVIGNMNNEIFAIDKPEWYESRKENIVSAGLYAIKGRDFKNEKNVFVVGSDVPKGKVLLSFFKNSVSGDGGVSELPINWWKVDSASH